MGFSSFWQPLRGMDFKNKGEHNGLEHYHGGERAPASLSSHFPAWKEREVELFLSFCCSRCTEYFTHSSKNEETAKDVRSLGV